MKTFVIAAAGGNPTAIKKIQIDLTREEYEKYGTELMLETEKFGVEQAGFLIHKKDSLSHFEMSGGEFCGNAARSAALVLSLETKKEDNSFTMSGFSNTVLSHVKKINDTKFNVICEFPDFNLIVKDFKSNGIEGKVVDLGGIVHIVVEGTPPNNCREIHRLVTKDLGLEKRDAVGVTWIQKVDDSVSIYPVVWVRSIDTFFNETSCGSGTIAVAKITGVGNIIQPSCGLIKATFSDSTIILESEMEIIYEKLEKVEYILASDSVASDYEKNFISLYKDAFGGAPYFEVYEYSWIKEHVWDFNLKNGCIVMAISNNNVVGLSCAIPVYIDKKIFDFLKKHKNLPFDIDSALYMSELAVSKLFRKSEIHIGSELVKKRIDWARNNGFHNYIMRTAAEDSNSKNMYLEIIGAKEIKELVQDVSENPDEIPSSSNKRIYLYGTI